MRCRFEAIEVAHVVAVLPLQILDTMVSDEGSERRTIVQLRRPQRITLVISSLSRGGAERVAVDLRGFLAESGRDVSVLTLSGDDPDAYDLAAFVHRKRIEIGRDASSRFQSVKFTIGHLIEMRRSILNASQNIASAKSPHQ